MTATTRVVALTDPERIKNCHVNNYKEWGTCLTPEQYLGRERGIRAFIEKHGFKITYWALEQLEEASGEWTIVSACETLTRPSLIKYKGEPVRENVSHSVGAVFTPKENRGKGYAKLLLSGVTEQLANGWLVPDTMTKDDTLVALWSDVGAFYEQFGYYKTDTTEVQIPLEAAAKTEWPEGLTKLGMADLAQCGIEEEKCMSGYIDRATEQDGTPRYVLPTRPGVMELMAWRAEYQGRHVTGRDKGPQVYGAATADSWLIWHQDFGSNTQYIMRAHSRATTDRAMKDLVALLRAAIADAQDWGMKKIAFWVGDIPFDMTLEQVRDAYNASPVPGTEASIADREKSWPMDLRTGKRANIKWDLDGKYAWF